MDEKRKAWCEKYKVNIAEGGFIEKYCMPEHVECILPTYPNTEYTYIGFDGKTKSWNQLTEEEKEDYQYQQQFEKKPVQYFNRITGEQIVLNDNDKDIEK